MNSQAVMPMFFNISAKHQQQHQHSTISQPKKSLASRSNIEFKVNALKVVELRRELRNRGYDTKGLKKDLRARLSDAMFVELEAEGQHEKRLLEQQNRDSISSMQVEHHSTAADEPSVNMTEAKISSSMGVQSSTPSKATASIRSPAPYSLTKETRQPSVSRVAAVSTESIPQVFKPLSEKKDELIPSIVEDGGKVSFSSHISADDNSPPTSEAGVSISKESGKMVKDMISKFSGQTSLSSTLNSPSLSAMSKEMKKMKEARMAKIAEMREKVRIAFIHIEFFVRFFLSTDFLRSYSRAKPNWLRKSVLQQKNLLMGNPPQS